MPTKHLSTPVGDLTIWYSWWNGRETLRHRMRVLSDLRCFGLHSEHRFTLETPDGREDPYLLHFSPVLGWRIERDGETIATNRPGRIVPWMFSLGMLVILIGVLFGGAAAVIDGYRNARGLGPWPGRELLADLEVAVAFALSFPLTWWLRRRI